MECHIFFKNLNDPEPRLIWSGDLKYIPRVGDHLSVQVVSPEGHTGGVLTQVGFETSIALL